MVVRYSTEGLGSGGMAADSRFSNSGLWLWVPIDSVALLRQTTIRELLGLGSLLGNTNSMSCHSL